MILFLANELNSAYLDYVIDSVIANHTALETCNH